MLHPGIMSELHLISSQSLSTCSLSNIITIEKFFWWSVEFFPLNTITSTSNESIKPYAWPKLG